MLGVYVANDKNDCDLVVYETSERTKTGIKDNKGIWFFTFEKNRSDKKIYLVKKNDNPDFKIWYSKEINKAGWINKSKKHFLD